MKKYPPSTWMAINRHLCEVGLSDVPSSLEKDEYIETWLENGSIHMTYEVACTNLSDAQTRMNNAERELKENIVKLRSLRETLSK